MPDGEEKLARATTSELTYANMKNQIKKICGTTGKEESLVHPVKEDCYYGNGRGRSKWYQNRRKEPFKQSERKREDEEAAKGRNGNPINVDGVQYRCYRCDSTEHFANKCPKNKEGKTQDIHITLLNAKSDAKQTGLVFEALGKGVLDSGCTKTVCGELWMNEYLKTIPEAESKYIKEESSDAIFRFGDGIESKSVRKFTVPVQIGKNKYNIVIHVVKAEIPLLISKDTMKKLDMKLNFSTDTAVIGNNEEVKLSCSSSGHYCLPLSIFSSSDESCNFVLHVANLEKLSQKEKMSKALKLHRQFGHATADKLKRLLKNSNVRDKDFEKCIVQICNDCSICEKYRQAKLKPAVSLPLADKFNQVVCLDLKEINIKKTHYWILHLIDASTRYSAARLITTKKKEVIVNKLFEMWIQYFGSPHKLMSDNGSEFNNGLFFEMSEMLGIEIVMPPADSPFSNGIVERHNAILYETMVKTIDDANCEESVGLAWACSAKNSLQNHNGFSPNQLVLGNNTNLPSVLTDELPALKSTTSSDIIRKNLAALHSARSNYMKSENSERIKRAIKSKTRTYAEEQYQNGDKVYFKRRGTKEWKGPGTVMGFDKYTVLVKQGGSVFKCHRCHLKKIKTNPIDQNWRICEESKPRRATDEKAKRPSVVDTDNNEEETDSSDYE